MRKTYILDTCVLVYDPQAYKSFPGHDVVIPINVLDELDKLKNFPNDAGKNARLCIRALDELCEQGEIHKGIKIDNDILLKIDTSTYVNNFGPDSYIDNKILACAFNIGKSVKPKKHAVLVSRDINLRIRARAYNIKSENYEKDKMQFSDLYVGHRELDLEVLGTRLTESTFVETKEFKTIKHLLPNECVAVDTLEGKQVLARRIGTGLRRITSKKSWKIEPKSKEQAMALDLLSDTKVPLVSLIGKAGTGKTLITLAAALDLVLEQKKYNKIVLLKPMNPTDKEQELGFLPGDKKLKLLENYASYFDAFEHLFSDGKRQGREWEKTLDMFMDKGVIQMEALAFLRGRSFNNCIIILDEAQNISSKLMKTVLTRVSSTSKIILLGDLEQVDAALHYDDNGLMNAIQSFKESELSGHITLVKTERGDLAELAAKLL